MQNNHVTLVVFFLLLPTRCFPNGSFFFSRWRRGDEKIRFSTTTKNAAFLLNRSKATDDGYEILSVSCLFLCGARARHSSQRH